jgi:hypothetical protein
MDAELKAFAEDVMRIGRDSFQATGVPVGSINTASSQTDIGQGLQREVLEFSRLLAEPSQHSQEQILKQAGQVEGYLRMAQTLSIVNLKRVDELISKLYNLAERK